MANMKISEMREIEELNGEEYVPLVQNGSNVKSKLSKLNEKNIITVTNSAQFTLTTTDEYERIGNLKIKNIVGDKLSLVENEIKIGKGISKVKVSLNLMVDGMGGIGAKFVRVSKNGVLGDSVQMFSQRTTGTGNTAEYRILFATANNLVDVVEGDTIGIYLYGIAGDLIPQNNYGYFSFTVEGV